MKRFLTCAILATATLSSPAWATDLYAAIGVPGVVLGVSQPVSDRFALRADVATLGNVSHSTTDNGITYDGKLKANRLGVFADAFVAGGFRLTGGVTFTDARYNAVGRSTGSTINIGGTTYTATSADGVVAQVKFPSTMPYLGIGYSSQPSNGKGWGFMFDAGLSIGKAKVTGQVTGPLAPNVPQSNVDAEVAKVRDDVNKLHGIPQLTVGVTYRF